MTKTDLGCGDVLVKLGVHVGEREGRRRERYVGPRLPEPIDTNADPAAEAERRDGLAAGILLLLERLAPAERAAYILREAFDYPYREIGNLLRLEEANARQLVTRARQHVANGRRMSANSTEQRRLLNAFVAAAQDDDLAGLQGLLRVGGRLVWKQLRAPGAWPWCCLSSQIA